MTVTAIDVISRHGLAAPEDVREIRTLPGRALSYQVRLSDGRPLFVKHDRPGRTETDARAEAETVRRLRTAGLVDHTPEVLATAPRTAVYHGYQDLPELDGTRLGPDGARALGTALARVHGTVADLPPTGALGRATLDWITVTPRSLAMFPGGYREVWARVAPARDTLHALAHSWRASTVIHGDLKADNVLLTRTPVRAVLLDWETAGLGDPMWDLGCAVGDRVSAWLQGLPLSPGLALEAWLAESPTPLAAVSTDLRTLLGAYGAADRVRVASYAGAFLLQRALAEGMQTERLHPRTLLVTHLATQFLTQPERTVEILL